MKIYTDNLEKYLLPAVNKLVDFLKPTYGPYGRRVLIQGQSLDDGYAITKEFELPDEFENAVIQVIKEVSEKTNTRVGDGTTTASILAQAFLQGNISLDNIDEIKKQLLQKAKPIKSKKDIEKVAYVSFKNKPIAKMIAEVVHTVGVDGLVTVEESNSMETSYEIVKGMKIDRGFISPHMATTPKQQAVYKDAYVLVTDYKISSSASIVPLLEKVIKAGKRELVIIAEDVDSEALTTLIINKLQGKFSTLAIKAPAFGNGRRDVLEDIATLCGATIVSQSTGSKLEDVDVDVLGRFGRVESTKDNSIFVEGRGSKKDITTRITQIKEAITQANEYEKVGLSERLAKLSNGVCVLKVGATTEQEMVSLKYKVEDAVNAAQVALRHGVVRGGGITLAAIRTGNKALDKALQAPYEVLRANGVKKVAADVWDPVDVLIVACETAVSIVSNLLSISGIIVDKTEPLK